MAKEDLMFDDEDDDDYCSACGEERPCGCDRALSEAMNDSEEE